MPKMLPDERPDCGLWIDYRSLNQTVEALTAVIPGRVSAAHIRDMIVANIKPGDNTYISTSGWVAYSWTDDEGGTHVKVAVEGYTVLRHAKPESLKETHTMADKPDYTSVMKIMTAAVDDLDALTRLEAAIDDQMVQSYRDAAKASSALALRATTARGDACQRALEIIERSRDEPLNLWAFKEDMSAGIIAFNEACRVLGIPAHTRTALAVKFWEEI